jgi:hypothetical protein
MKQLFIWALKELLFSFVKKGYNDKKLAVNSSINNNFFNINDLQSGMLFFMSH